MLAYTPVRCLLYGLAFLLLTSKYWLMKYGLPSLSELISILSTQPSALFTFQRQHLIVDLSLCFFIYPLLFTFILILCETWFFRVYTPLVFLLFSLLHVGFNWHGLGWVIEFFLMLFILSNWRCLTTNWKKTLTYCIGFNLLGFSAWTYHYIGTASVEQWISTVVFGFSGLLSANLYFFTSLIRYLVLIPLGLSICFIYLEPYVSKKRSLQAILPITFILAGLTCLTLQYKIPMFIKTLMHSSQTHHDNFAAHYHDPASVTFQATNTPKSLILIYVESLESTYQDTHLFDHNLLTSLTNINQHHVMFHEFKQTSGADWTIAGIIASQCGIPLKLTTVFGRNDIGSNLHYFLPGATCLSDVLSAHGYTNVFLNGASLHFAGINNFLKTHHYDEMMGKHEWLTHDFHEADMIGWGLPDDLLFKQAKLKLHQLAKNKQPFNLTLLTIDTHGLDGQLNTTCYARGGRTFEDIVECTANNIADFIAYVESQGILDRVTIVIMGDHVAMKNVVSSTLEQSPNRYVFNMVVDQAPLKKNRDTIFHVDLFPTVLNILGITWPSNQLAMGYSAVAEHPPNLSSSERFDIIEQVVSSKSNRYDRLWLKN
jgi:phosphoglycerol transferase